MHKTIQIADAQDDKARSELDVSTTQDGHVELEVFNRRDDLPEEDNERCKCLLALCLTQEEVFELYSALDEALNKLRQQKTVSR